MKTKTLADYQICISGPLIKLNGYFCERFLIVIAIIQQLRVETLHKFNRHNQSVFICSKSTIETLEKGVKCVQS